MHTPVEVTEEALLIARSTQADSVISIGGGSTIGLGKAIRIRTSLYHIAIATTYAGSEATPILGETEHAEKKTRSDSTCLANVSMALHNKLCHALGGGINLPHAETNAVILPHALAFNAPKIPETMERLANVLPESNGDAIQDLNALLSKLDLHIGLRELGMLEHQIDEVADSIVSKPYWNPRPIERATIRELLRRTWAGEGARG
ncbi:hypothetical protein FANTH_12514 [Fusarium anthophilum]|uniref:Fe-containing alcohol dehydrogenase-like C-terminal domain-containing protein n=1 Tax=Fusarium anthophilum TaxID=48485 RepID=A0A8H5DRT5_9HYPO|nr:hypothetical protein FANTH_12514 [Fusarium anthophilum]